MNPVLTNKGGMKKQVVDALKLELYERNIVGGYNNLKLMDFFKKNWIGWRVGYQGWR